MSYAVFVRFKLLPGSSESFLPLMRDNANISRDSEPGCLRFDVLTDPERPDEVSLYEVYTQKQAFADHCSAAHFLAFDAATRSMIKEKQVITWSVVDP